MMDPFFEFVGEVVVNKFIELSMRALCVIAPAKLRAWL